MMYAQGRRALPAGNFFVRVPGTTTAPAGTSPRISTFFFPRTSMIGVAGGEHDVRAEHGPRADAHALDHDAARADERAVLDDHGRGLQRLEHAADPDAAGQVHVGADLRARADRRPRVDHRVLADPGADVHVARA